ncbi:fumarylacetoacetate hydrolase family protein [Nitrospinae bacterium]|nr:fumarylacetoacetate hydrolase family protein [Nitrospinota bacterium]
MKIGQCVHKDQSYVVISYKNGIYLIENEHLANTKDLIIKAGKHPLTDYINNLIKTNIAQKVLGSEDSLTEQGYTLRRPIDTPEAWAVGVTYRRQALEHDKDLRKKRGKTEDLYQYAYRNERAEVFFKGLSRTIVGSGDELWLRPDSSLVMPEAELVLVIGNDGLPIAYTLGNDLTAWDIESECPLYLSQAKIWVGSGSIGPWIIPTESTTSPYSFNLRCVVKRNQKQILDISGSTSGLKRSIEELCFYMNYSNLVAPGTVLFTGTTCVIDHDFSLKKGDSVEISTPQIGVLENRINIHSDVIKDFPIREGGN